MPASRGSTYWAGRPCCVKTRATSLAQLSSPAAFIASMNWAPLSERPWMRLRRSFSISVTTRRVQAQLSAGSRRTARPRRPARSRTGLPASTALARAISRSVTLMSSARALARGGDDDDPPRGVRLDDVDTFGDLLGVRQGGAAEFRDFHTIPYSYVSSSMIILASWISTARASTIRPVSAPAGLVSPGACARRPQTGVRNLLQDRSDHPEESYS